MIGVSNQLLLTLITLLTSTTAAQAQFTGCFIDSGCATLVVRGRSSNAEDCCVNNNAGLYYNDGGQCFQCIVYGFGSNDFTRPEAQFPYNVPLAYFKGPSNAQLRMAIDYNGEGTASEYEFGIGQSVISLPLNLCGTTSITFQADRVALEPDETFVLELSLLHVANVARGDFDSSLPNVFFRSRQEFIIQDSTAIVFRLRESDRVVDEGNRFVPVEVTVTNEVELASDISLVLTPMIAPEDFTPPQTTRPFARANTVPDRVDFFTDPITLNFMAGGEILLAGDVLIYDDMIDETLEYFVVTLTFQDPDNVPPLASIESNGVDIIRIDIIDDDDIFIGFALPNTTYPEVEADHQIQIIKGAGNVTEQTIGFVVNLFLTAPPGLGNAIPSADGEDNDFFLPSSSFLSIGPEENDTFVDVTIIADELLEVTEAAQLRLSLPTNGLFPGFETLPQYPGFFIIIEDDERFCIGFEQTLYIVNEGIGMLQVCVRMFEPPENTPLGPLTVSIGVETVQGTADGDDYTEVTGARSAHFLFFSDTSRRSCLMVEITEDDQYEVEEQFSLRFIVFEGTSIPDNLVFDPSVSIITILDNDVLVVSLPVRLSLDLRLTTRNLTAPTDGFEYSCVVNGVNLTTRYENESSILCIVGSGQLELSAGVGSSPAVVMVTWPGNDVNNSTVPLTEVTLYDCRNLASGCSECIAAIIGLQFPCGWCGGSCEVMQECSNTSFITEGDNCPAPVINSFTPMSGPVQGGTEITVNGTDLGVFAADIQSSTLTLGGVACSPISTDYMSGRQFVCVTTSLGTEGPQNFSLTIGSRKANVNAGSFTAVYPTVNSVTPTFGPMAGGTTVAVSGTGLDVGNQERTEVSLNVSGSSYVCKIQSIQSHEIRCTTTASNLLSDATVVVSIDDARISNPELVFSYLNNPNVINVSPSNTISSGGIMLTFTGLYFDVVQQRVLEVYPPTGAPLRSNCSLGEDTTCSVVNITTITCSTPNLLTTSLTALDYALLFDEVPPGNTQARLPISVQSDPSNFRLNSSEEVISGIVNRLRIVGDNLDSVETSEIHVTVGGEECVLTSSERGSDIICTVPLEPPGGENTPVINVTVGSNIAQVLDKRLTYNVPMATAIPLLEIVLPLSAVIILLAVCVLIVLICLYLNSRKKSVSIGMHQQNMELVATGIYQEIVDGNTALVKSELDKIAESIPDSFKIPSSILKLSGATIGQGEFGIVYKGVLADWNDVPMQGVAVKTLKGLFSWSDVQSMMCEVNKMQDLHHPHVMSLIGVCLDAGPGIAIVMPYMTNGSLFDYLKRERSILELDDDCEIYQILALRKLLLKMCHQIALGMAYLAEQKFVHRDLAARNCMLDSGGGIRVGDFGLAEDIYASGYFRQNNRANAKVPYKWMALESLNDAIFTEKTDVWSYGVTVWEIFNGGRTPYPAVNPLSLIQLLGEGQRLERPLNAACATEISVVMRKCWRVDPEERPTFSQLSSIVERLLIAISGYTELSMVLVDTSQEEEQLSIKHDCVPPPTKVPHHLPSADPITTENSAYCLGEDSQEKEERSDPITTENSAYCLGEDSQEKEELSDPITTENSAYCLGEDSQEKEELSDPITTENSAYCRGEDSQAREELFPHHFPSADPITTENSAYCRGEDSQEKEELYDVPMLTTTGEVPHHYGDLLSVTT